MPRGPRCEKRPGDVMKRRVALIVLGFALVGLGACSTGADPQYQSTGAQATAAEKSAAMESLRLCLVPAAARLDDHQSDASTIAAALRGACQEQWETVASTSMKGESPAFKASFAEQLDRARSQITLNAVLAERHPNNSN